MCSGERKGIFFQNKYIFRKNNKNLFFLFDVYSLIEKLEEYQGKLHMEEKWCKLTENIRYGSIVYSVNKSRVVSPSHSSLLFQSIGNEYKCQYYKRIKIKKKSAVEKRELINTSYVSYILIGIDFF